MRNLWHGFSPGARRDSGQIDAAMLTDPPQQCGMTEKNRAGAYSAKVETGFATRIRAGLSNPSSFSEGANGGQKQRPRRDVAEHDRRNGEGVQLLCQSGDDVAGIFESH